MQHQLSSIKQKLTLIQLADSFFPSGSYTLSHGLESLKQQGKIQQSEDITDFLKLLLQSKIATCDLVALIQAHQASMESNIARITAVAARLQALTLIETTRKTQLQSGRALLMVAQSTWEHTLLATLDQKRLSNQFHCLHPVVFGVVGSVADLNQIDTALAFLHGFVTGVLGAAIRLGSLGHLQAQEILLELSSEMEIAYHTASKMSLEEMWSCTPSIDLGQMHHPRLNSRLFAS